MKTQNKRTSSSLKGRLGYRFTRVYATVVVISVFVVSAFFVLSVSQQNKTTIRNTNTLLSNTLIEHMQYFEFAATKATMRQFNTVLKHDRIALYDRYNVLRADIGHAEPDRPPSYIYDLTNTNGVYVGSLHFWQSNNLEFYQNIDQYILIPTILILVMLDYARRSVNNVLRDEVLNPLDKLHGFIEKSAAGQKHRLTSLSESSEFKKIGQAFANAYTEIALEAQAKEREAERRRQQAETLKRVLIAGDIVISYHNADKSKYSKNIGADGEEALHAVMQLDDYSQDNVLSTIEANNGKASLMPGTQFSTSSDAKPQIIPNYIIELEEKSGEFWTLAYVPMNDGSVALVAKNETKRHKAELNLRQSQKMDALGVLTSGVAHDFNNVLAIISGSLDDINFIDQDSDIENLNIASSACDRAAKVVRQLLDYASANKNTPDDTDQAKVIKDMYGFMPASLGPNWPLEICIKTHDHVQCDPHLFEAALLNLVVNARDASPNGGEIKISSRPIALAEIADGNHLADQDYICISVEDHGTGIDAELSEKIFDPFFTTKELGRGTGLGLSMVYGMAKRAGGHVSFKPNSPQGTIVSIILPVATSTKASPPLRRTQQKSSLKGKTVLLVEDDVVLMKVISRSLIREGMHPVKCSSEAQVLNALHAENQSYDFVLSDIQMPEKDGYYISKLIHDHNPALPIILMSGNVEMERVNRLPFTVGVIEKPFNMKSLHSKAQEIIQIYAEQNTARPRNHAQKQAAY